MATHVTTVSRDGQVTIPAEIRRALDLKEGVSVTIEQHGEQVLPRRSAGAFEQTAGILSRYRRPPLDPRRRARRLRARRGRRGGGVGFSPVMPVALLDGPLPWALEALAERVDDTFTAAGAAEWLDTPNRVLRGATPSTELRAGRIDAVEAALEAIDSGVYT